MRVRTAFSTAFDDHPNKTVLFWYFCFKINACQNKVAFSASLAT
jgi:hypothetical protein